MKTCSKCGELKTLDQFHKHKRRPNGLRAACKTCVNEANTRRRNADRSKHRETSRRSRIKNLYGLDPAAYDSMMREQGGRCAICQIHKDEAPRGYLCVDHCHETGAVRQLLCHNCNVVLGLVGESRATLKSMITYLEGHQ